MFAIILCEKLIYLNGSGLNASLSVEKNSIVGKCPKGARFSPFLKGVDLSSSEKKIGKFIYRFLCVYKERDYE